MGAVFEATIKKQAIKGWYIELKDTLGENVAFCLSVEELETKIEECSVVYGGFVDEVRWLKDDNLPPHMMDDVRVKMAEQRDKIEEKTGESIEETAKTLTPK